MTVTGDARVAGVIGWPVAHSLSPLMHGYWLAQHGIDGAYVPLRVRPEQLEVALRALPALGFRGANVTVPHKEAALKIMGRADATAKRIGAVNTLIVAGDGMLEGRNTDGYGFIENLRAGVPGFDAARGPAVVLGAGGAARAVVAALIDAGAPEIRVANRTAARAGILVRDLGAPCVAIAWESREAALAGAALLVNTTSLGMTGQPPLSLDLGMLPGDAVVNDIVYAPLATSLLAAARARGNPTADGLGMLLYQAVPGFEAWFGVRPAVTEELRFAVLAGGA